MTTRRDFITGLISFVAAPAIVRVTSIMPVKSMIEAEEIIESYKYTIRTALPQMTWRLLNQGALSGSTPRWPT